MEITDDQQAKINKIGEKHSLDMVVLHGSRATGKMVSSDPDVDIAVYRSGGITGEELLDLVNEFMSVFGNATDVKTLHKKDSLFRYEVMRDARLLYGDPSFFNEYFIYTYKDYLYKKPLYRNMAKIQHKRQQIFNRIHA